jgi:hypothetical protein
MRLLSAQRGNGLVYGALATALLILLVGALYDVYAVYHYRTWGYQAAGEAARRGVLHGTGLDYAAGVPNLDEAMARAAAEAALSAALARRGITDYRYDIRVLTAPTGGTIPGFPPVARANLDGGPMALTGPGVGVYLEYAVPTAWLHLIGQDRYQVHVFSAAQATEVQP